jgi:hypothetical protein
MYNARGDAMAGVQAMSKSNAVPGATYMDSTPFANVSAAHATGAARGAVGTWAGTQEAITAAAKLYSMGYIANPTTPWKSGQFMTIQYDASSGKEGTFYWDGTTWHPGVAP